MSNHVGDHKDSSFGRRKSSRNAQSQKPSNLMSSRPGPKRNDPPSSHLAPDLSPSSQLFAESVRINSTPKESRHKPDARPQKYENILNSHGSFNCRPSEYARMPATVQDLETWKGWCELESEPAFFNVMLREFGVAGVKVQEVISLDDEMLAFLPKPIYGLIFLFQFKEDDPAKQEAICPDHIWFANQTTSNACASVALLNIIMNAPDINLGPVIEQLKDFSMPLTPALRGYTVSNHDNIRRIHNSFARKMDMLNSDLFLSNNASTNSKESTKRNNDDDHDQASFHFVAFIPIGGCVWKLDGLERQPMNLGRFNGDWMDVARPLIQQRMQQYEDDQIQFNLLSLCQSPLLTLPGELAINIRTLLAVEDHLGKHEADWRQFIDVDELDNALRGPDLSFGISKDHICAAEVLKPILVKLSESKTTVVELFKLRQEFLCAQAQLRSAFLEEVAIVQQDNERASGRRHDYSLMIYTWVKMLAQNGGLRQLVEGS